MTDIVRISGYLVSVPLEKPYKTSLGVTTQTTVVVVEIETQSGIIGFGEADPLKGFTDETPLGTMEVLEKKIAPVCLGMRADEPRIMAEKLDHLLGKDKMTMTKGAIDIAMWDILGKSLGVPVYTLLGGLFTPTFPILWPFGAFAPDEDPIPAIKAKMDEGYRTFMLKTGGESQKVEDAVRVVKRVNEYFGPERIGKDIHINVDANQGWNAIQAKEFFQGIKGCKLSFVEQPLPNKDQWLAHKELRTISDNIPLSVDEGIISASDALRLVSPERLADIFSLKVSKSGGISRLIAVDAVASVAGIKIMGNSMIELGITQAALLQYLAALPPQLLTDGGHCFMSTLRCKDDITDFRNLISSEKVVRAPSRPGLGIDIDMSKLIKYTLSSFVVSNY